MTILVVDDTEIMRRLIINSLSTFTELTFEQANDGQEALEKLRSLKIDFVILDWVLPQVDGVGLLRNIRSDKRLRDTPVLFVTAKSDKQDIITAIKERIDDYMTKPFTTKTLIDKINGILRKKNMTELGSYSVF